MRIYPWMKGGKHESCLIFRFGIHPVIVGNLGHPGSIRPGYIEQLTVHTLSQCLDQCLEVISSKTMNHSKIMMMDYCIKTWYIQVQYSIRNIKMRRK